MAKNFLNTAGYPLGLRNNNPGNLRDSGDQWQGMIGTNKGFVVFADCSWGLRALAIDLSNKIKGGYNTIEKIITRYAPPSENDTDAYIDYMVGCTLIAAWTPLQPNAATLLKLMRCITEMELGFNYSHMLSDADFNEGISLMGSSYQGNGISTSTAAGGFIFSVLLFTAVAIYATRPIKPYKTLNNRRRRANA